MRKRHCLSRKSDIINVSWRHQVAIFAVSWKTCLENKTNKEEKTAKRSAVLEVYKYSFGFPRNTCQSILLREEVQPKKCWLTQEALECRWPQELQAQVLSYFGLENGAGTREFLGLGLQMSLWPLVLLNSCPRQFWTSVPPSSWPLCRESLCFCPPLSQMLISLQAQWMLFCLKPSLSLPMKSDHSFLLVTWELSQSSLGNPTNYLTPNLPLLDHEFL